MAFFGGIMGSMYVLFAIRVLHLSPALLGAVISIGGVAAVCGTFVTGPISRRFGIGPTLIGAAVLTGMAALLNPMAHGPLPMAALFLAAAQVNDIGWTVYTVNELSLRQSIVHPRLLGRVNSATQLLFRGLIPLGALAGGALAQAFGIRAAMWIGAGGFFLSPLWLIRSPLIYLRKLPEPIVQ
jgi:predicted MFS family arabinose efflux permease